MKDDILRGIDQRLQRIEEKLRGDLIKVTCLAAQLDVTPQTIRRHCARHGIHMRTMHGDRYTDENKGAPQYVSRRAWQSKEAQQTQAVKRRA